MEKFMLHQKIAAQLDHENIDAIIFKQFMLDSLGQTVLTLQHTDKIRQFEVQYFACQSWLQQHLSE